MYLDIFKRQEKEEGEKKEKGKRKRLDSFVFM